MEKIRHIKYQ